jgi:predicted nucleotidyltransferase
MGLELPKDFKEFLSLLRIHGVEYLVIGAYAVGYHGYPRATKDLDIWIAATPENAKRVVTSLKEFGFSTPELTTELLLKPNNIVRMGEEPMRIEVLNWASGVNFEECYGERITDTLDGVEVSLIGLEHLKINKKASGRLKDLADLEELP